MLLLFWHCIFIIVKFVCAATLRYLKMEHKQRDREPLKKLKYENGKLSEEKQCKTSAKESWIANLITAKVFNRFQCNSWKCTYPQIHIHMWSSWSVVTRIITCAYILIMYIVILKIVACMWFIVNTVWMIDALVIKMEVCLRFKIKKIIGYTYYSYHQEPSFIFVVTSWSVLSKQFAPEYKLVFRK